MSRVILIALSLAAVASAQQPSGAAIANAGAPFGGLTHVAPGQVIRLTLSGRVTALSDGNPKVAMSVPLPTGFDGVSVTLRQRGGTQDLPLAHLRLSAGRGGCAGTAIVLDCAGRSTDELLVQVPFELKPNPPGSGDTGCAGPFPFCTLDLNDAILTVHDGPDRTFDFRIDPVVDQVHILNYCEDRAGPPASFTNHTYRTQPCGAAIVHADAEFVTAGNPALPGEPLALYAWGLGAPDTPIHVLDATPAGGVPITRPFTVSFTGTSANSHGAPDYVGLVGGSAGLYQVNFRAPADVPANLAPCGPGQPFNMSLTLTGTASTDTVSFCMKP